MTDQKKHDHWGDLVSDVGATPPTTPDDDQCKCDAELSKDAAEVVEAPSRKPRPYRPKSGWNDLAQNFDLPPGEEPAVSKEEPIEEEAVDKTPTEAGAEDPPEDDTWRGVEEFDSLFDGEADGAAAGDDKTDEKAADETAFEDAVAAASEEIEQEEAEQKTRPERERKQRRRRPAKTDAGQADDKSSAATEPSDGEAALEAGGFGAGLFAKEGSENAEAGRSEQEEDGQRRGRRRRKRGPRRKKDTQKTVVEESLDEAKDALDEDTRDDERTEEEQAVISHHGIPTWDEAVDHIIATNLEKRSKRGDGPSSRSRGGRRRGGRERSGSRKRPS